MKHLEEIGKLPAKVESYLFPNYKVKPYNSNIESVGVSGDQYSRNFTMENPTNKDIRQEAGNRTKTHLLESTKSTLLLQKIFHPYLILVRILGNQPLKIHSDGSATFKYLSWNSAFSASMFGMFIFDTIFFLPIMRHMNSEREQNFLVFLTEVILVSSQIFAAFISYIFVAFQAKRLACFWNRLQAVLVKLMARCPNHLSLVLCYRIARMKIIVWVLFTVVFGACYIASFHDEITNYLKEQHYNRVYQWTLFIGFAGYSMILSLHILHSTGFSTFVCVLISCFRTLGNITMKQDGQGTMRNSQSRILFQEVIEIYEELTKLKSLLGRVYGLYMAFEILAMIICVTINFYFMISNWGFSSLFLLNVAIAMPYLIWFHEICVACEFLNCTMEICYRRFRKAMSIAAKKVPPEELSALQVEPPGALSASGYFLLDLKLFTSVMGTIATYLVVMLQFALSSGTAPYSYGTNNTTEHCR